LIEVMRKMPKLVTSFLKAILVEILIVFIYVFVINNYIGNVEETIKADAIGYYDYLPSLFIHHDLVRFGTPFNKADPANHRVNSLDFYKDYHGYKVNKYPCGTAVLELPFFTQAYLTTGRERSENDGYQWPFQRAVFHAALFYLFLTIFFLKKTLESYDINRYVIIVCQLLLVLGTTVTHYANFDAGFSHLYSLFAITAFIYFARSFFKTKNLNHFISACLFLGIVLLVRELNILILFFVPFLAGSAENLKDGILFLLQHVRHLIIGLLVLSGVFFIQCFLWYLQCGTFLLYSYQGEGFNFTQPHMIDILFSYKKGLFVYAPILFIALCSLIWLVVKRKFYLAFTWLSFFLILTYMLSSWHTWESGCSYGLRAYVDTYSVFIILFALMLNGLGLTLKLIIIVLSLLTIPLNIIQTYQYKEYILDWQHMNKDKYWKIFLKTNKRFKSLLWKRYWDYEAFECVKDVSIGNISVPPDSYKTLYQLSSHAIPEFGKVNIIEVLIDNEYKSQNDTKIILSVAAFNGHHSYYWFDPYFIHFSEKQFNEWQTGLYDFEITPMKDTVEKVITLEIRSDANKNDLDNVRIKFLKLKFPLP
jgi:hypothetical protein